jgi:hypothetical protein
VKSDVKRFTGDDGRGQREQRAADRAVKDAIGRQRADAGNLRAPDS